MGAMLFETYALGLLADACITNKRYREAFGFLERAQLRLEDENSERYYAAEIYRLLGKTNLQSNKNVAQADQYFSKSLKIAREQKARSFELRLCLDICDLYGLGQDADKFCPQLGEIYGSFSEGFGTVDLVGAKARLDKVSGVSASSYLVKTRNGAANLRS